MFRFILFCLVLIGVFAGSFYYLYSGKPIPETSASTPAASESTASTAARSDSNPAPAGPVWSTRCDEGKKHCEIFQRLEVVKTKQRLVELAFGFPENKDLAKLVAILPHGLLLSEGMTIKIDDKPVLTADIQTCTEIGCIVSTEVSEESLSALRAAKDMTVMLKDNTGKTINIILSLDGFDAAITAL